MGQVTLQDGSTAVVTKDNWQQLAAKNQAIADQQGLAIDPQANLTAFQEAGNDTFFPGDGPATVTPPGGGNAFLAGLEELFTSPTSFAKDAVGIDNNYVPPAAPGGGSPFVAGLEDLVTNPSDFLSKLPNPVAAIWPGTNTVTVWLIVGVVGILGVAYIAHKAL